MTVGITGSEFKLAQEIIILLSSKNYSIVKLDESLKDIERCDIFINCLYKNKLQENLLKEVFILWKDQPKYIINIVSSSVLEQHAWAESFVENKKKLAESVYDLSTKYEDKKVKVTNLYPFTLSSNKSFDQYNKVEITFIANTIEWLINTPKDQEIRDITIFPTSKNKTYKIDKLL